MPSLHAPAGPVPTSPKRTDDHNDLLKFISTGSPAWLLGGCFNQPSRSRSQLLGLRGGGLVVAAHGAEDGLITSAVLR